MRQFLDGLPDDDPRKGMILEVEVDTLEQLELVLPEGPDIVLYRHVSTHQGMGVLRRGHALPSDSELFPALR